MGVVYRARDRRLDRIVALKFLGFGHSEDPEAMERFRRETHAIAALNHPHIAVVYESGEWDGEPFMALEFLPGGTLRDRIHPGGLSLDDLLTIARQLGSGLDFTHRSGILHRDIKPANGMFGAHGELKLVDFGLAKFTANTAATGPGVTMGTVAYMAPEVLNGQPSSVRSDVYSFGAVLYELAAGRPMFPAESIESLYRQVLSGTPEPISRLRPDLPRHVADAIKHAIARKPEQRTASVAEFLTELGCGLSASALPAEARTRTLKLTPPRSRRRIGTFAAALAASAAILWFFAQNLGRSVLPAAEQTVVVLPFENLGDPTGQTLTAGLQETVTSMLSHGGERTRLLVVPSVEVRRNQVRTIAEARKLFSATLALTGSVQSTPAGLQVTLALTDAKAVRLKDSAVFSVPADGSGLQQGVADGLVRLFGAPLAAEHSNAAAYSLYVKGQGALEGRDYPQAVALLQKAVDADSGFTKARTKLALACLLSYRQSKDPVMLARGDAEAARAAAQTADALLVRGLIRDATGDSAEAIALLRQYRESEPNDVEGYGFLADALIKAGRNPEAEETLQQAIRLRPGYWPTYQRLAIFYLNQQQFGKSERAFLTGIGIAPESSALHSNLGGLYFKRGRWPEAAAEFERSLQIRSNPLAHANLGTVRFFEGNYTESARQFELATKLQPNNAVNWGNLGDALWQIPGSRDRAREAYSKAETLVSDQLGLDPAGRQRKNRAVYLVKLGRTKEALAEIAKAIEQEPKDGEVQFFAARVYAVAGLPAKAIAAVRNAVALGYSASEIQREPDFAALRRDPAFPRP